MNERAINSVLFVMLSFLVTGASCGARPGNSAADTQSEEDVEDPVAPVIPPPPPKEQSEGEACRAAWYLSHDVEQDGDPFAILGYVPGVWTIDAEIDGMQVHLEPEEFVGYEVNVVRKGQQGTTVDCKVPVSWKARVLAIDVVVPAIAQDLEHTERGRTVKARAGIVDRSVPIPGHPVASVELAWFLEPWKVTSRFKNAVRKALRIGSPLALKFESDPTDVEDRHRPGLAVGISESSDPSGVRYWGVLSDNVREAEQGSRQERPAFLPFGVELSATEGMSDARLLFAAHPTYNLQNLVLWDTSRRGRLPCRQVGGRWEERCGNILPLYVKSLVLDEPHDSQVFAHVLWRAAAGQLLLTTVRLNDVDVAVEKTIAVDDPTELGLAPESTLRHLQWP